MLTNSNKVRKLKARSKDPETDPRPTKANSSSRVILFLTKVALGRKG